MELPRRGASTSARRPPTCSAAGPRRAAGTETERICRTVHGPVQERGGGAAYARRYAIWGRELETLVGLAGSTTRDDIDDVDRADAPGHLERERHGRRQPGQHRLLAPRPAPAAARAAGTSACPTPAPARPSGAACSTADAAPARHQPQAGLAGQLEQRPVGGLDERRRARRASALAGAFHRAAACSRWWRAAQRGGPRSRRSQRDRPVTRARSPSSARSPRAQLRRAARGATGKARRCSTRCWPGTAPTTAPTPTDGRPGRRHVGGVQGAGRRDMRRSSRGSARDANCLAGKTRAARTCSTSPTARRTRCARCEPERALRRPRERTAELAERFGTPDPATGASRGGCTR